MMYPHGVDVWLTRLASRVYSDAPRRRHRLRFRAVAADGLVEPGELEDVAVVLAQAAREELLLPAVDADEQGHQQADPAAVHVLQPAEVEDDRAGVPGARLRAGVHQRRLGAGGEVAADVHHADPIPGLTHVHRHLHLGHDVPPSRLTTVRWSRQSLPALP